MTPTRTCTACHIRETDTFPFGDSTLCPKHHWMGGEFEVALPDGRYIGRTSLTSNLGPVARGYAYPFTYGEAVALSEHFDGTVVAR